MTDENDPKPTKKTSAVPLRKETVRVTLKATPEGGDGNGKESDGPPAPAPTIPLNAPAPTPSVPAPAPTVKLQTGAPTSAPLKTVPVDEPDTAKTPEPAPTVKLDTPGTAAPTGTSSQPLPQATVQMQPSQEMAPTVPGQEVTAPTIVGAEDAAAAQEEGSAAVLSVIAMVAALIVLGVQLGTANIWVNDETQENPGWGKLFE